MATAINFVNSEKLSYMYENAHSGGFNSVIEPVTRRTDTVGCSNSSSLQDTIMFQKGKTYMDLQIKKRNKFTVTYGCNTGAPVIAAGVVTTAGSNPALLNSWNWTVDNLALSKAINSMGISYGQSELKDGTDLRNPFLMEIKSAAFDLEESKHYGIVPLQDSGAGALTKTHSTGVLNREQTGTFNAATFNAVSPLVFGDEALKSEGGVAWRYMNNNTRIKISNATFQKVDGNGIPQSVFASTKVPGYIGEWVPMSDANNSTNFANIAYGSMIGTYTIIVEEYLVGHYLTTPYQKNKRPKVIKIKPWNFVNLNFQWDVNYIQNGMFKISINGGSTQQSSSQVAWLAELDYHHFIDVVRDTSTNDNDNSVTLTTFDLLVPPPDDFMLRMVGWEPTALEANPVVQSVGGDAVGPQTFTVLDQTSPVLPKYVLIAVDPRLYDGQQFTTIRAAAQGQSSVSTFMPAKIETCNISINQTNVTENISINDLIKMTQDLNKNKQLRDIIGATQPVTHYETTQFTQKYGGCPFLLLDLDMLNMMSLRDGQMISNVQYPTAQTLSISFTFKTQAHNFGTAQNLNYYPRVYKFYPYKYSQVAGEQLVRNQLFASYAQATEAVYNPAQNIDVDFDVDMVGGGWLEDVGEFFMRPLKKLGQSAIDGVRMIRNVSRVVHETADDLSRYSNDNWGYGKRKRSASARSSRKGSAKRKSSAKRSSSRNRSKGIIKRK